MCVLYVSVTELQTWAKLTKKAALLINTGKAGKAIAKTPKESRSMFEEKNQFAWHWLRPFWL